MFQDISKKARKGAQQPTQNDYLREIDALNPWFYPLEIGGVETIPGVTTDLDAQGLTNRVRCRRTMLVEEVLKRYDFRGKHLLDLACNSGYWSSHYARAGAERLLGVEGRELFVKQAKLYWGANHFLPETQYQFVNYNVCSNEAWRHIEAHAPFHFTLCAGILYHIPDYRDLLARAASVTRDVMVVDTRVGPRSEQLITEPGDLKFNAIQETIRKTVPYLPNLLGYLVYLGFEPEVLPVKFFTQHGINGDDDYNAQKRVTIFAKRVSERLGSTP